MNISLRSNKSLGEKSYFKMTLWSHVTFVTKNTLISLRPNAMYLLMCAITFGILRNKSLCNLSVW